MKLGKITCCHCGVEYERPQNRIDEAVRNGWRQFCSKDCHGLGKTLNHPHPCVLCGTETVNTKFCSHRCAAIHKNTGSTLTEETKNKIRNSSTSVRYIAIDWESVQTFHDAGGSPKECWDKFALGHDGWSYALKYKLIIPNKLYYRNLRKPISLLLIKGHNYNSRILKRCLISEGILENKCYVCGITDWCGEPITLQLHHIDGDNKNNELLNLTILCPNCHSQTPTYGNKRREIKQGVG